VACGVAIRLVFKYDAKAMIPLLMACFDRLNPTSQACVVVTNVPNFQFEEEEGNMFGVGTSMEESSCVLVVGQFLLGGYLSLHLHV
jgi:hypothetical protein